MNKLIFSIFILFYFVGNGFTQEPLPATINMYKIMMIESSGDPLAWNREDDSRGLYQITPICLEEWNIWHAGGRYTEHDLWDPIINKKIASWYMNVRIPEMIIFWDKEDTVRNRLIAYNAGISYVAFDKELPKITNNYLKKYYE